MQIHLEYYILPVVIGERVGWDTLGVFVGISQKMDKIKEVFHSCFFPTDFVSHFTPRMSLRSTYITSPSSSPSPSLQTKVYLDEDRFLLKRTFSFNLKTPKRFPDSFRHRQFYVVSFSIQHAKTLSDLRSF